MDIRHELEMKGLTPQQMNAKAVEVVETILCEKQGVEIETLKAKVKQLSGDVREETIKLRLRKDDLNKLEERIAQVEEKVTAYKEGAEREIVNDDRLLDTLNFYTALLARTQAVFGAEKMTEAVIVQLLETASYGIWRSIMGGKFTDPKDSDEKQATDWTKKYGGRK